MKQYNGISYASITPEFLKKNDGKLHWIGDDYLACSGYVAHSNPNMYEFLEHVYSVKQATKKAGYRFEN